MLSIQSSNSQKTTPNLLPARIQHNGPINDAQRYWKPETDDKGKQHAYFRGRHLHGTPLPVPANYTGAILQVTDKQLPQSQSQPQTRAEDNEEDEDMTTENETVNIAEQIGEFDEIVVWGHGGEVDGDQDMYVRGLTEWVGFAESIHVEEEESDKSKEK